MKKQLLTLGLSVMSVMASAQVLNTQSSNDYLTFSFPVEQTLTVSNDKGYNALSNEYFMRVTGAQLNQGITVNTTQSEVALLISRGSSETAALDTGLLQLRHPDNAAQSLVTSRVSAEQLSQVSLFSNTVALKTAAAAPAGALKLSTQQALSNDDKYLVQIKEKNSPYELSVSIPTQTYTEGERVIARGAMLSNGKAFKAAKASATLIAPNGDVSEVNVRVNGTDINFTAADQSNIQSPINGMYELHVESAGEQNGLAVQRNAKVAFALSRDTATLRGASIKNANGLSADVKFVAKEASRFEVRGVLYGTNSKGRLVPVMETHAAQNTNAGAETINLAFDAAILKKAGVKAPYELRDVRLFDQKQLGMIDTLNRKVVFGGAGEM